MKIVKSLWLYNMETKEGIVRNNSRRQQQKIVRVKRDTILHSAPFASSAQQQDLILARLSMDNDDTPPGGRKSQEAEENANPTENGKLSAKSELQMKVKQIAKELADEPAQHVRDHDSYLRTFNFNALPLIKESLFESDNENHYETPEVTDDGDAKNANGPSAISINIDSGEYKDVPTQQSLSENNDEKYCEISEVADADEKDDPSPLSINIGS